MIVTIRIIRRPPSELCEKMTVLNLYSFLAMYPAVVIPTRSKAAVTIAIEANLSNFPFTNEIIELQHLSFKQL